MKANKGTLLVCLGYYNKSAIDWVPSTTSISHSFGGWEVPQQAASVCGEVWLPDSQTAVFWLHPHMLRTFWLQKGTRELSELYAVEKQYGIQPVKQRFWRCLNIFQAHIWFGTVSIILPIHAKAVVCSTWLIKAHENWLSRVCHYYFF